MPRSRPSGRSLLIGLALLLIAGCAWWFLHRSRAANVHGSAASSSASAAPVGIATSARRDVPVYLSGLGQAQAWNTVTIHARVDGQIEQIGFRQGEMVKQGDLLIKIDSRPFQAALDQAKAKLTLDQSLLENSQRDLKRYTSVGPLAVTQQQIDTQRSLVAQQTAQLQSDQAAIESAQAQLSYTTITAPIAGRVGFRLIDRGNIVHPGDPGGVVTITQTKPMAVLFSEPETDLARIRQAMAAGPLPCLAYTSDGKTELAQGSVSLISNQVDQATGSIQLKGRFDNADDKLWPGLTVATRLRVDVIKNAVVIPDSAVQRGPDGLFAWVVGPGRKVHMTPLQVGPIEDGVAVIESGLQDVAEVVVSGQYRLVENAPVRIVGGIAGAPTPSPSAAQSPAQAAAAAAGAP